MRGLYWRIIARGLLYRLSAARSVQKTKGNNSPVKTEQMSLISSNYGLEFQLDYVLINIITNHKKLLGPGRPKAW